MRPTKLVLAAALVAAACTDRSTPVAPTAPPHSALANVTSETSTDLWQTAITGQTGPGSLYAIYIPRDWNGDVIYFVHGILPPTAPVELPDDPTDWDGFTLVRDQLGAQGFALAYSSFSENGLALKDAAQRTHQLRGLVASVAKGQPKRSFIVGYSLGSAAALQLVEQYPRQYDGAVLACGMVGGTPLQLEFIGHVRALFDYYYPGALPGDVVNVPDGFVPTTTQVGAIVQAAITANAQAALGMFAIASTAQTPLAFVPGNVTVPGVSQTTLATSLTVALWYQLIGVPDVIDRTHGHSPFDNSSTTYTMGTPVVPALASTLTALIAGSNVGVDRYSSPPDAQNLLDKYYVPTGNLKIPVITVHNLFDYLVPFFHEQAFGQIVQTAGASDLLLQRAVPDYGHCSNTALRNAAVQGVQDLVTWVNTGAKPTQ